MPQLSDTMSEGTLVKWLKKEGDKVKEGDAVAEVETDKAVMPMESFDSGTLAAQLVKEGEKVKVGVAIAVIAHAGEDIEAVRKGAATPAAKSPAAPAAAPGSPSAAAPAAVAPAKPAAAPVAVTAPAAVAPAPAEPPARSPVAAEEAAGVQARIRVSPLASRVAAERGIDLRQVRGSGPNGRIVLRDVEQFDPRTAIPLPAAAPAASVPPAAPTTAAAAPASPAVVLPPPRVAGGKESIPLTKMRQVIAQRLQHSKQTIPHFYCTIDIDMEAALALREKLNKAWEKEKIKLSVNTLVMKAVAVALTSHPALNAHFKDTEIVRFADVNLGVAVALPDGLIVPVLRGVQNMGLKEIHVRTADLADRARKQKLKGDEMSGGTFTISNLGAWGVTDFGAIVNPPEVGILAVAAAEPRAVVHNGELAVRTRMTVTLSGDHRAIDGANAADFLKTLKSLLEEPALMLA